MARLTALQLYKYLPGLNCGKCDESTCMAFAIQLIERKKKAGDCTELTEEGLKNLVEAITPPVRDVEFHVADNKITVGGEEVLYRHELKFFNATPLFIDVSDSMDDSEIDERIDFVTYLLMKYDFYLHQIPHHYWFDTKREHTVDLVLFKKKKTYTLGHNEPIKYKDFKKILEENKIDNETTISVSNIDSHTISFLPDINDKFWQKK